MHYDIFNGDADGICALHQFRLDQPKEGTTLVTGVKRDVTLLARIEDSVRPGDTLTVFDVSMESNSDALGRILNLGATVVYVDHHFAGDIPSTELLTAHIDPSPDACTSLIVDRLVGGRYRAWAVVGAFGDNLHVAAQEAAETLGLNEKEIALLRELGELLNYNGYGAQVSDLHFPPQTLYEAIQPFASPFDFMSSSKSMETLRQGFISDMAEAHSHRPLRESGVGRVFLFPAEPWSRRVAGVFSNEKARGLPGAAHALVVDNGDSTFLVSVRAPLERKTGADTLCRAFPTGGGRAAAAGINALPAEMLEAFLEKFTEIFAP